MAPDLSTEELLELARELVPPRYLVVCRPEDEEPVRAAVEVLLAELADDAGYRGTATFRITTSSTAPPGSVLLMRDPDDPRTLLPDAPG